MLKTKLVLATNCLLAPIEKFNLCLTKPKRFWRRWLNKSTRKNGFYVEQSFFVVKGLSLVASLAVFLFFTPTFASNAVFSERVLPEPTKILTISDQVIAERAISFSTPLTGRYISTYFSLRHPGIDIPNPNGTAIKAISEGTVFFAGWSNAGYGNLVIIEHKDGFSSLYAHLSTLNVKKGQHVFETQVIGTVGATGNATGNHLHIEVHLFGRSVNPLNYFFPL